MTNSQPTRPSLRHLLTRDQVITRLREERAMLGLTKTAEKYNLKASQVCDVLSIPPRAQLSKKMWTALKFRCWEFFEKLED